MNSSENNLDTDACTEEVQLTPLRRRLVTCLLLFHLAAIVIAPWSVPPSSLLSGSCWEVVQPYLQSTYLNHGYHFFAPEPGASHLIRYELTMPNGETVSGRFPDKQEHWPRLLYHRHFMLTEALNRLALDEADNAALTTVAQSYADHLIEESGAQSVRLFLQRHYIPSPQQVLDGLPLGDESLYAERPLGEFSQGTVIASNPPEMKQ
ncbi:MAG: hypothetical protein CMJ78_14105 [Planctomycetaceae bacterium]|nr:hypothetical protein [Planctomycetaceae bacterium]